MSRVICVSNHKGGVGKTTVVANLGFALARNFKVLLIDIDPQANLSSGLGFTSGEETLSRYFKEKIHFRFPTIRPSVINEYVHIIPANVDLIKIEDLLHETARAESVLNEMLFPLKSIYDLILLDCPPSFNLLTLNALHSCNLILIPAKPEIFSINGIGLIKKFATDNAIPYKIIFNQVNTRSVLHQKVISDAGLKFNGNLLGQSVRNNIALAEAFEHARDIFNYNNTSQGAEDFANLAEELIPFV
jgi:chromosome partitioning protein